MHERGNGNRPTWVREGKGPARPIKKIDEESIGDMRDSASLLNSEEMEPWPLGGRGYPSLFLPSKDDFKKKNVSLSPVDFIPTILNNPTYPLAPENSRALYSPANIVIPLKYCTEMLIFLKTKEAGARTY
jgi:hypothetical protein